MENCCDLVVGGCRYYLGGAKLGIEVTILTVLTGTVVSFVLQNGCF